MCEIRLNALNHPGRSCGLFPFYTERLRPRFRVISPKVAGSGLKRGLFIPEVKHSTAMCVPSYFALYSFNKYLLSIYYMPRADSVTGAWQRTEQMKIFALMELDNIQYCQGLGNIQGK